MHGGVPYGNGLRCLDDPATHRQQEVQFVLGDCHGLSRLVGAVRRRGFSPSIEAVLSTCSNDRTARPISRAAVAAVRVSDGAQHPLPHEVQVHRVPIVRVGRWGEDADADSPRFAQGEVGAAEAGEIVEGVAYHLSLLVPVLRRQTVHHVPTAVQWVIAGRAGSFAGHPVDEPPDQSVVAEELLLVSGAGGHAAAGLSVEARAGGRAPGASSDRVAAMQEVEGSRDAGPPAERAEHQSLGAGPGSTGAEAVGGVQTQTPGCAAPP